MGRVRLFSFILVLLLVCFKAGSQTLRQFNGQVNITNITFTGGVEYTIKGIFTDASGTFTASDAAVNDQIIDLNGNTFNIVEVSASGPLLTAKVSVLNGVGPAFGAGTVYRPTRSGFPLITTDAPQGALVSSLNTATLSIDAKIPRYDIGTMLPSAAAAIGTVVFYSGDSKVYKMTSSGWTAVATGAIPTSYAFSSTDIPTAGASVGDLVKLYFENEKVYTFNGSSWVDPPTVSVLSQPSKYGDMYYVTGEDKLYIYDGNSKWVTLGGGAMPGTNPPPAGNSKPGDIFYNTTENRIYVFNGSDWVPMDNVLEDGKIYVGNANNIADPVAMSGDVTIDNTGKTTISDQTITLAKLKTDPVNDTLKVYVTDVNGIPALVSQSDLIGKIPSGSPLPDSTVAVEGQVFYNIADHKLYVFSNGRWIPIDVGGSTPGGGTNPLPEDAKVGDVFYNTNLKKLLVFNGTDWLPIDNGSTPGGNTPPDPAVSKKGDLFYDLDDEQLLVFDGTNWVPVSMGGSTPGGNTPPDPAVSKKGDLFYDLDDEQLLVFDGTNWVPVSMGGSTPGGNTPPDPAVSKKGDLFYDLDDEQLLVFDGSNWVPVSMGGSTPGGNTPPDPAVSKKGDLFYDLDDEQLLVFDGIDWVPVGGSTFPSGSSNPATGIAGDVFYNTTESTLYVHNGTAWVKFKDYAASDNLGNHTATANLKLGTFALSNDGGAGEGLTFDGAGNASFGQDVSVNGNFYTPSDRLLKKDIATLTNVMQAITGMRGVKFEYIDQKKYASGTKIGVIAQELQKVYPEMVTRGKDGFLKVDYTQLSAVLIEAVKEQQQQIRNLSDRIAAQQEQIDDILKRLNKQ